MYTTVRVADHDLNMELDTGAFVTVISKATLECIWDAQPAHCNRFQIRAQGLVERPNSKCTINQMSRSKSEGLSNTGTYISDVQSMITKGTCLSTKSNSGVRKVLPDEVSK